MNVFTRRKNSENPKMLKMIQQVSFAINETLKPTSSKIETDTIIAAYALYKVRTSSSPFSASYHSLISGDLDIDQTIAAAIQNAFDETAWVHLSALLPQFSAEVFAGVISSLKSKPMTPLLPRSSSWPLPF